MKNFFYQNIKAKLLFIGILFMNGLFAQFMNNVWYFGKNAGLNFSSGSPVALTDGAMITSDNTASIARDKTGELCFYSNGEQVWNREHEVMPNGDGLLGHETGGNSAYAVKQPGSDTLYYLFTSDAFAWANGIRYSIIDMSLDSGRGDVTAVKNVPLLSPATEKIVAVLHANNNDIWIIMHPWNSNSFYSYLLTNSSLSTSPVVSTVGSIHTGGTNGYYNACGQIAASPDGDKIVCAIMELNKYELFDFDRNTGVLSNLITISGYNNAWGAEFSRDGKKLYTTRWYATPVYQFDLSSYIQTAINNSVVTVGQATSPHSLYKAGYLKRGPDDKIYVAKYNSTYLGAIEFPNNAGMACTYNDNYISLGTKQSQAGLPAFLNTNFYTSGTHDVYPTESMVNVYPNPVNFSAVFNFKNAIQEGLLCIYDLHSRKIREYKLQNAERFIFYKGNLATGTYMYEIISMGNSVCKGKILIAD